MELKSPPGKLIGITAYLTFIGLLIAYFINRDAKHEFARAHIKNMFGLLLIQFTHLATYDYISQLAGNILWWTGFCLWIFSLGTALLGHLPAIPLLSKKFKEWFLFLD